MLFSLKNKLRKLMEDHCIKLDKNRYGNDGLSKITQKNLFNNVQKSNSDKNNDKSININFKKKGKSNNKNI